MGAIIAAADGKRRDASEALMVAGIGAPGMGTPGARDAARDGDIIAGNGAGMEGRMACCDECAEGKPCAGESGGCAGGCGGACGGSCRPAMMQNWAKDPAPTGRVPHYLTAGHKTECGGGSRT